MTRKAVAVALFLGLSLVFSGCGTAKNTTPAAPLVKTMIIGAHGAGEVQTFSGTVHGIYESALAFQVGGRIMQRFVNAGDRVSAGQRLFRIDSKDAEEQVEAARSSLNAANARYDLAKTTTERYQQLRDADAISALAMDQTKNQFDLAAAQLASAKSQLARAENNLGFTLLSADRDGVVGSTMYEVGQVVAAGMPVALIVDDSSLDVHVSFTEKQYREYSVGMPCTVTFWALPDVTVQGRVREIAAAPNASTGTYDAKITLEDPPKTVALGMTASVAFDRSATGGRIMIPLTAMSTQSGNPAVWVIQDGKAHLRTVEIGRYGENTVEITSGLAEGDKIVTAGVSKLSEGEEVRS
ncbi:MAG: efflux RND transporter periplasmic adaptor subunit [Dialister sp.]|nr:efflux RND transporter periplasmic adaptor subunit [Dialister sp.]